MIEQKTDSAQEHNELIITSLHVNNFDAKTSAFNSHTRKHTFRNICSYVCTQTHTYCLEIAKFIGGKGESVDKEFIDIDMMDIGIVTV